MATIRAVVGGLAAWWLPVALAALLLGSSHVVVELALFFSKLAVLSFGGAYALLAWLADAAVSREWVTTSQMIAGLGLAETTPGPTILVTQFVGFIAGYQQPGALTPIAGALVAAFITTWVTFAPSFLWIFAGAPGSMCCSEIRPWPVPCRASRPRWWVRSAGLRSGSPEYDLPPGRLPRSGRSSRAGCQPCRPQPAALALALIALALTFLLKRSMLEVIGLSAILGAAWVLLTR